MRNFKKLFITFVPISILLLSSIFIGCDSDDSVAVPVVDKVELTRDGWLEFENQNWEEAKSLFKRAIDLGYQSADPYSGYGWAIFKMGDDLPNAIANWNTGLNFTGATFDIEVGLGFAAHAQENHELAVSQMKSALAANSNYTFKHLPSINYEDLQWTIAQNYYLMGEFDSSYVWVKELNSHFTTGDLTTKAAQQELVIEIERLWAIIGG